MSRFSPEPTENAAPIELVAMPIDAARFQPYGQLLMADPDRIRTDFTADLSNLRPAARLNLAVVKASAAPTVLRVTVMERHLFSAQSFLPLDADAYLVVVALDNGSNAPDLSTLAAFEVIRPVGINYHPGVWHLGMQTLEAAGTLALLVHEDGSPDDCHYVDVPEFIVTTAGVTRLQGVAP